MENYADIIKKLSERKKRGPFDDIVLVDGMNMLIRSFAVLKTIKSDGTHVGGLLGFLRSLNYTIRMTDPTRVVIIWDGKGGATNRKNLNSNYKAQRTTQITNWGMFDTKDQEREALSSQLRRLMDYLDCLPVQSIMIEKLEADDIIAFLAKKASTSGKRVTIVSTDKDFYQLVNKNIQIYRPVQKNFITNENVKKHTEVLPENYNVVKSMVKDTSDNIDGIKGAGPKTLVKCFPKLLEEKVDLDYIYKVCEEEIEKKKHKKIYAKILVDWDKVETNYKIVDLHNTMLGEKDQETVYQTLKEEVPPLRIGPFLRLLDQDNIDGVTKHTEGWLQGFSRLEAYR